MLKKPEPWKEFLNDQEGVLSLKPWDDAAKLGINKKNGWPALRAIFRQAWSEYIFFSHSILYLIPFIAESGRTGAVKWGAINKDPETYYDPEYSAGVVLTVPERLTASELKELWDHLVFMEQTGKPFYFLSEEKSKDKAPNTDPPVESPTSQHFSLDEGIPLPFECSLAEHTKCLLEMTPDTQIGKIFIKLVKMVDLLEVRFMFFCNCLNHNFF